MRSAISLALLVLLASCAKRASPYDKDLSTICSAPARSGATGDSSQRATMAAKWIAEAIRTDEAKQLFSDMFMLAPEQRVKALRDAAAKAGLKTCPLADEWEQGLREPPRPGSEP